MRIKRITPIVTLSILSLLSLLCGLLLVFSGKSSIISEKEQTTKYTDTVTAIIVDYRCIDNEMKSPIFEYEYNGKKYVSQIDLYSNDIEKTFPKEKTYTIRIIPNNPNMIILDEIPMLYSNFSISLVRIVIGLSCISISIYLFFSLLLKIIFSRNNTM